MNIELIFILFVGYSRPDLYLQTLVFSFQIHQINQSLYFFWTMNNLGAHFPSSNSNNHHKPKVSVRFSSDGTPNMSISEIHSLKNEKTQVTQNDDSLARINHSTSVIFYSPFSKRENSPINNLNINDSSLLQRQSKKPPIFTSRPHICSQQTHNPEKALGYYEQKAMRSRLTEKKPMKKSIDLDQKPYYAQLVRENERLRREIEEEYKPMKKKFDQLVKEQEERDYLISQLEWKVRELAKEVGSKKER